MEKLQAAKTGDKPALYPDLKKYIGTRYDFVGLSVPRQRQVFKTGFGHDHLTLQEQLKIWDFCWRHSNLYEVLSQALLFISHHLEKPDQLNHRLLWKTTRGWVGRIDNWAHSDSLSAIYSYLLEKDLEVSFTAARTSTRPKAPAYKLTKRRAGERQSPVNPSPVYKQLKTWNLSANPWERRQSVVSLLEYDKKRKTVLPAAELLSMVEPLLGDEDYFVQKGVGWTLREIGNRYPGACWQFLLDHVTDIRPAAFTAAIEKLDPAKKERLKKLRKKR
ncbi:MAG: DNA alkylation repair protein [Puia sp.]|nr:DNA alkylation repair protein [Puia sp.]